MLLAMASLLAACNTSKNSANQVSSTDNDSDNKGYQYYIDVHKFGAGNVTAKDVAAAHVKDLEAQAEFGVTFLKYWVDEQSGHVYCLSKANNPDRIVETHKTAHGLVPDEIHEVTDGEEAAETGEKKYFLDIHELGAGNVTAHAVAEAHEKDLAKQNQYQVNFIQYWVDEKAGKVFCLSEANDSTSVIRTHKDAHGLLPNLIMEVKQGQ
jgi:hypothetical protein